MNTLAKRVMASAMAASLLAGCGVPQEKLDAEASAEATYNILSRRCQMDKDQAACQAALEAWGRLGLAQADVVTARERADAATRAIAGLVLLPLAILALGAAGGPPMGGPPPGFHPPPPPPPPRR